MATTTELTHSRSISATERFRLLIETAYARIVAGWNAARNRRAVAHLLEWDDRMLSDIGLTQGDVRSAMSGRLSEDPSPRLSAYSGERRRATRAIAREARTMRLVKR
jgi:uncharacterized protein YjiS (DUF1127 family)